jgi:phosphonopyruvate decarboxylase
VGATSEGEAVAIAAGAWLAGQKTVVMCQNSGLGNAVNPLTSLSFPFRIPTLLVVTWRGQPGIHDEPQHELMGQITGSLLDAMRIPHRAFPTAPEDVEPALDLAEAEMGRSELPFGLVMARDTVRDDGLEEKAPDPRPAGARHDYLEHGPRPTRLAILERFLAVVPDAAGVVATTGKCGRELFTLADRPQHLYQVGSMGGASAMGLGVALHTERPVVVLDGDGAALMKLGNLATIGSRAPANLVHVVLDNGVHDSTGGQATVSPSVDFAAVALACGYASGASADSLGGFEQALRATRTDPGPHLIHVRIAPGSLAKLGRPTVTPPEVARRFRRFLAGH